MNRRSHERWTPAEDKDLAKLFHAGSTPSEIAASLGRSELAIRARLANLLLAPPISPADIEAFREGKPPEVPSNSSAETIAENRSSGDLATLTGQRSTYQATVDVQQAFHRFHFVYAIVNPRGQVYVGYSQDVWHRIGQHNRNLGAVATRNAGPWFPFAIHCFAAEADARAMETHVRANFAEYAVRVETSMREVLAQIGTPLPGSQIILL